MPAYDSRGRVIPVHRLRPNETTWSPPSVIFLDTETRATKVAGDEHHTLRLWAACHVDRRKVKAAQGPVTWGWGPTAADLAEWVDGRMVGRECVWLFAHNLSFDLVTSRLTETMPARGWTINEFSVGAGDPWLRISKGRKTLTVTDSGSWLPKSLAAIAKQLGRRKLPLPKGCDGDDRWLARCATDVDLLGRAMLDLLEWWDREQLGRWQISGAGCGWSAFRHIHSHQRHVIDVEPAFVALDREAARGGRKDSQVCRSVTGGRFVELDFETAYPTVAREIPLPVKRGWTFDRLPLDSKWIGSRICAPVARCVIRTDVARYPVKHQGVTWYPVGTFATTLAGPEIEWARDNGDLVAVGHGQMHHLGIALRPWATWILDPTRGGTVDVPPVAMIATKEWGRRVIGKWAAHSHRSERLDGPAPPGWDQVPMWDARVGRKGAQVTIGGRSWFMTFDGDTENCYPAVYAWVESEVRVRLGRILDQLGPAWIVADTDGLTLDVSAGAAWLAARGLKPPGRGNSARRVAEAICDVLAADAAPLTLRPKRTFTDYRVIGPQHTVAGADRKISGVSKKAREIAPDTFEGLDWPSLRWQVENSPAGTYTRPLRRSTFTAPTTHRWVLPDGSALPVEMRVDDHGDNELVAWPETRWALAGAELAGPQYRMLNRVAS